MKAELIPENGDPPIPVTRDISVVGRRDFCDIVIDDSSLSKRHCVLVKTDGLLVVRDLGSTNGTKVKGQRIRWAALLPDDKVTLGRYKVRIYLGPDNAPAPSELAKHAPKRGARSTTPAPASPAPPPLRNAGASVLDMDDPHDDGGSEHWRNLANQPLVELDELDILDVDEPSDGQAVVMELD